MRTVFEVRCGTKLEDYGDLHEAIRAVEGRGSGSIVRFMVEPNLPGLLPKEVHRSIAMWSYNKGIWLAHEIHGPGSSTWLERPDERY